MPTTYLLKEKAWTFRESYQIRNERGDLIYQIKGKFFSASNKFYFQDALGNNLLTIKKRWASFRPKYKIIRDNEVLAEIQRKKSFWSAKFKLDLPGRNDYIVEGNFWKREYKFERGNKRVAQVSRKLHSWTDTFGVKIEDGEHHELILATVLSLEIMLKETEE